MGDIPDDLRAQVARRADNRCEYCQVPSQGQVAWFPVDHIIPRSQGGQTELQNLALACPRCNGFKWAFQTGIDPVSGEEVPLYHPRRQNWKEHFAWSSKFPWQIEGRTPVGRATIHRLKMNDAASLTIRRLLNELGIMSVSA